MCAYRSPRLRCFNVSAVALKQMCETQFRGLLLFCVNAVAVAVAVAVMRPKSGSAVVVIADSRRVGGALLRHAALQVFARCTCRFAARIHGA